MAGPEQRPWAFLHALELYRADADCEKIGPVLVQARRDVEELTEMAVDRAAQRETWETIGRALNVSRQGRAQEVRAAVSVPRRADVEQAADVLREMLTKIRDGELEAPGRRGQAVVARLEGALLGLDAAVRRGTSTGR